MTNEIQSVLSPEGIPEISVHETNRLKNSVRLIDVRRPEEFHGGELGRIFGSKLVTLETEFNSWMNREKDRQIPTVFICRSGNRSGRATIVAKGMGFENVYNMQGGMLNWNQEKLPLEKE